MSELGRGLKGLIDPGEQIAIDEQLLAQQSDEIGQAQAKRHSVAGSCSRSMAISAVQTWVLTALGLVPTKVLMLEILLEGFEEQLDLPAFLVDRGDSGGGKSSDDW